MSKHMYIINNKDLVERLRHFAPSFLKCVNYDGEVCYKYDGPVEYYIQALTAIYPLYNETIAYESGDIFLDLALKTLRIREEQIHITPEMFAILEYLMANNFSIVSLDRLSEIIVGSKLSFPINHVISNSSLRTVISKMRTIFRRHELGYMPIQTSAKNGYYWCEPVKIIKRKKDE